MYRPDFSQVLESLFSLTHSDKHKMFKGKTPVFPLEENLFYSNGEESYSEMAGEDFMP